MDIQREMSKLNSYTARVDRMHPMAFLFLIDQSGSMDGKLSFDDMVVSKDKYVADAINKIIEEVIAKCTKTDETRHYFDIAVIGYGKYSARAEYIFTDGGMPWLTPQKLNDMAMTREEERVIKTRRGEVKQMVSVQYWIDPLAVSMTPMYDAFTKAKNILADWCDNHLGEDCYPPIIINITDGEQTDATDEKMVEIANEIKAMGTIDGNALLFNIHLSSGGNCESVMFPSSVDDLDGSSHARMLYEMSSELPSCYNSEIAKIKGNGANRGFRAMGFNTKTDFVHLLNVGTMTNVADDDDE